jgi:hypothetical protein
MVDSRNSQEALTRFLDALTKLLVSVQPLIDQAIKDQQRKVRG